MKTNSDNFYQSLLVTAGMVVYSAIVHAFFFM